jgi:RNA methyltransferase, TrmH family
MITSVHNPKIQTIRTLQSHSKARREEGAFVIEGVRLAEEALQATWEAQLVLCTTHLDSRGQSVVEGFSARGVPVEQVSDRVFAAISETETPQGLLAVLKLQALPIPATPDFLLVLDGVRDPGNLGTILRSAAAAGVQAVLLSPGSADAFAPKVVRAGMGAHFRLPIRQLSWEQIKATLHPSPVGLRVYLAEAAAGTPYTWADFRSPLALVIGGEAEGAGQQAASLTTDKVHISMPGGSESLNAGVAASILLFEVVRQRGL